VVGEQGWKLNATPASYEQLHCAMLGGLLGNIGCKSETEDWYLGARGIKFHRHPGAHLSKKPGRWVVCAELVETTRLFGRGIAAIDPQWIPFIAGHLLKKQLLEPHWEKNAAEVVALERATLYGIVVYSNRRVNFGKVDAPAAREIFILTEGGPAEASHVLAWHVYVETFRKLSFGTGSALAYIMALVTFFLAFWLIRTLGRKL